MEISHVMRSQEWIPTTPMHVQLYEAFGWKHPQFCHLPMVMGPDGGKLSKRHGATQLLEFRKSGFVPDAIVNFISLLGWAYDDKREMFSLADLEKLFSIEKINKSPAVFNYDKLSWFNGVYIREMEISRLVRLLLPLYHEAGLLSSEPEGEELDYFEKVLQLIRERISTLEDAPQMSTFMFGDQCDYETWDKIYPKKVEPATIVAILKDAIPVIRENFDLPDDDLKQKLYDLTEKHGVKAGAVFMPVRIAVTGTNQSPDLVPVLKTLGKERVIHRLETAAKRIESEL
jgi:glutamyl-tRNA synthetase